MLASNPSKKSILIVDDEENILLALERIFEEEGYEVFKTTNGFDGIKILENNSVQVVISDQRMPTMTGSEFLTQVNKQFPHTVRILLSAYSDFEATRDAINSGAIYKLLSKPWEIDSLLADVESAFKLYFETDKKEHMLFNSIYQDKLTGLPSRLFFNQKISTSIVDAFISKKMFAVVIVDIERFRFINNREGEEVGDEVLRLMAARLKKWIQIEDNLARIRNDQFILLIEDIKLSKLDLLLSSLLKEIKMPFEIKDKKFFLLASIGVSIFPNNGDNSDLLIKRANKALIYSKKMGGNTYNVYSPKQDSFIVDLISESELLLALEEKQFVIYYQPIISIKTNKIAGAEALIRWQHPAHGLLDPDKFISLCEESGAILRLGEWVLRTACEQLHQWHLEGHRNLSMAINLSVRQFNHSGLFDMIQDVLKQNQIPFNHLELEITESAMMFSMEENNLLLNRIKNLGVRLSLDDFGTGYSSLSYLKQFSIDTLKIDKLFVEDLTTKRKGDEIVNSIISLAKSLNLNLIAEGVETEQQLDFLREKACDFYQGYLFSKPVPKEAFSQLLGNQALL